MGREDRVREVVEMCREHGCSDKIKKIHFDQYVDRHWHPHPPPAFIRWWEGQHEFIHSEVRALPAWNCEHYRQKFIDYNHGVL